MVVEKEIAGGRENIWFLIEVGFNLGSFLVLLSCGTLTRTRVWQVKNNKGKPSSKRPSGGEKTAPNTPPQREKANKRCGEGGSKKHLLNRKAGKEKNPCQTKPVNKREANLGKKSETRQLKSTKRRKKESSK